MSRRDRSSAGGSADGAGALAELCSTATGSKSSALPELSLLAAAGGSGRLGMRSRTDPSSTGVPTIGRSRRMFLAAEESSIGSRLPTTGGGSGCTMAVDCGLGRSLARGAVDMRIGLSESGGGSRC
eukprot:6182058-Pleurochrysis_carterae.AAC.4